MNKKLIKLSASAIKTYESCKRKYWYSYIDKRKLPRKNWPHLVLGNFVHKVLEDFHNALLENPDLEWRPLMSECANQAKKTYKLDKESRGKATEMIESYLQYLERIGMPNVLANEESFNFKLSDDVLVRGYIDRVDIQDDGTYHVVDYKTGKSKYLDEFQVTLYALHIQNKTGEELEQIIGSYQILSEDSSLKTYKIGQKELKATKNKILKIADDISTEESWEPNPTFLCKFCDFSDHCEYAFGKVHNSGERTKGWGE